MRILNLRLKDFKGVADGAIQPQPSGITIIVGPNEVGKSSLLEGFDLLLNELDSSVKREVKGAKKIGRDEGPAVEAEIEAGAYRFKVRKRWLRRQETELHVSLPSAEVITSREAHERMREILESSVDMDLFEAVRYMQGDSVGPPQLPTRGLLTEALDRATGGVSDTEESASLFEAIQEEYRKYYNARDEENRANQDLRKQVAELETQTSQLRTEVTRAQEEVDRHERLSGELAALQSRLLDLEEDQKTWGTRLQEVQRLEDRTKVATAELQAAEVRHAREITTMKARADLSHDVEKRSREVEALTASYDAETRERERARNRSQQAETGLEEAERRAEDAQIAATLRRKDHEFLRLRFDSKLLSERGERAERALKEVREAREVLAKGGVTDDVLEELRGLQTALTVAQQKLEVASPTFTITALTDLHPIVGGKSIALNKGAIHEAPVPERLVVEIPSRARLEIKPGTSLGTLQEGQRAACTAWEQKVSEAKVTSLAEAVESNRSRNEAARRKKDAEKALRLALRTDDPEPFANVDELSGKLSELRSRMAELEHERPPKPPRPERIEEAELLAREAEQALVAAQAGLRTSRDVARRARDELVNRQVKEAELRSRMDQVAEIAEARQRILKEERERTSDDSLARTTEAAEVEAGRKREAVEMVQGELRKADPEGVRTRVQSIDAAVLKARKELGSTQIAVTECGTRLEMATGKGIHDELGVKEREFDAQTAELASIERRARAARRLFETLSLRRSEAQRAYAGPLRERIEELGQLLHGPTFKVALAEDLSIESRELEGVPIPFHLLSAGAREQLGIIVRLAAAMLVGKDGQGVPVIIDDALGFSDPERLKAMGAVLDQAGKECQILILTCYPERYGAVGTAEVLRFGA